jgi:hypothetical protein
MQLGQRDLLKQRLLQQNLKKHTLTILKVGIDALVARLLYLFFIYKAAHHKYFVYIFTHQKQISLDGTSEVSPCSNSCSLVGPY